MTRICHYPLRGMLLLTLFLCGQQFANADGKVVVQLPQRSLPDSVMSEVTLTPSWCDRVAEEKPQMRAEATQKTVSSQAALIEKNGETVQNLVVDSDQRTAVELPELQPNLARESMFLRGNYRGILAWNSKTDDVGEEILIVETVERSTSRRNETVLSIIPLPGKPIAIERSNFHFDPFRESLAKKYSEAGVVSGAASPNIDPKYPCIASYTIFVLKIDDLESLLSDVKDYLAHIYFHDVLVDIAQEEFEILQSYWDRGFRYFAFDLSILSDQPARKSPILFHFQSSHVYFPLAISAIGGTGDTLVDLIVITPSLVNLTGAIKDEDLRDPRKAILLGNTSIDFTMGELKELAPSLVKVYEGSNLSSVKVRNFLIRGKIDQFAGDFTAIPVQTNNEVKR